MPILSLPRTFARVKCGAFLLSSGMDYTRPDFICDGGSMKIAVFKERDDTLSVYEVDKTPGFYRYIERLPLDAALEKYDDTGELRKFVYG